MEPLYYCEKCGKPVYKRIGKYDTGRFCSISCANSRINKREGKLRLKSTDLYKSIDVENSPYNDYDSLYYLKGNNCYQFIKHNENNTIVKRCTIPKYRYEMEYRLGRKLKYNEIIHHIDINHDNNSPDNLVILYRNEHSFLHNNFRYNNEKLKYPLVDPLIDQKYDSEFQSLVDYYKYPPSYLLINPLI